MGNTIEAPHGLVGQSARIRHVQKLIDKLGRSKWPALLLGETGTGKEVVARAIHNVSPAGPFVIIDCSAMVGPLMESELFGHVKGSFTGAVAAKPGLIELANGGTAFFDEIGELPLDLQAKLLRLLQEKEFRPVGSLQIRHSDFRIIAATNRDLAKEVDKGMFRRDLYYRLNVVTVRLAPLRERRDDIPGLAAFFLEKYGHGHVVDEATLDLMMSYDWPGNVRELENAVQQMVALHSGPALGTENLPSALQNFRMATQIAANGTRSFGHEAVHPQPHSPNRNSPILPLAEVERRAIMQALEYTRGDRAVAAQLLGIGRTTLYRKLKEYEVAV
jgi:transcriptional regulator with PAS, ATPase and Fis domain